jgi:RNA polymerase sigma factor (TIGR02999 family)
MDLSSNNTPLSSENSGKDAADEFLPQVYTELRRLANVRLLQEKPGQTLQATALVHEAWIRLSNSKNRAWQGRTHFFAAAAEAMRRILIEQARRKATLKRGEGVVPDEWNDSMIELKSPPEEILAVHEALDELAQLEPTTAQVVKWKYFVGMTFKEIAEVMEVSSSTIERHWAYARVWLRGAIRDGQSEGQRSRLKKN